MTKTILNFSKVLCTKIKTKEENPIELVKYFNELFTNLPKYVKGSPENRTNGYTKLEINTKDKFSISHEGDLFNLLITKRFINEDYGEITVLNERGEEEVRYYPKPQLTEIFWIFPDLLVIMGSRASSEKSFKALQELLKDDVDFNPIEFPHSFFMWLECCLVNNDGILDEDLKIIRIEEDETEHPELRTNRTGIQTAIKGSDDAIMSPQTLSAIANGHEISNIRINFELDDELDKFKVSARITRSNGIFIFRRFVKFSADEESRYLFSLIFLKKIFELFQRWEKLPKKEKEPTLSCYEKMYKEMEGQSIDGVEYFGNMVESLKEKKEKAKKENKSTL